MSGLFNAAILSFAWFAVVNAAISAVTLAAARVLLRRPAIAPARLLALRLLPSGISTVFVLGVFLPAHWRFEPRGIEESFGTAVYVLALIGLLLVIRAVGRVARVLHAGWRLRACKGLPQIASTGQVGVYEIPGMHGVSLAGVFRPRILVGMAVREALTRGELEAAVAHEVAHGAACDNWKRLAIYCAPDFVGGTRTARQIERAWSAAAECQADARAVAGDARRAAELASALVKVARLGAAPRPIATAWSTLHQEDEPLLATRVRHLLAVPEPLTPAAGAGLREAVAAGLALAVIVGALAAQALHELTETLAHILP